MLSILNNYIFFLFLTTLAVSDNLVLFFISWVGLNISLYGILLKSFNSYNKEITLKYFISGSIVTMFLLFSILIYFMDYFTFSITTSSYLFFSYDYFSNNYSDYFYISKLQKVFYSILICSLLFKLGSFPFHFYLPDMYQSLNEKETMFIYTIALKISIFVTLIKFLTNFWYLNDFIFDLIACSGFSSMFISSFSMLKQYKLSKFWAYSYLNSLGFSLLAISSGISSELGEVSFYSSKIYFFTYLITWFGLLDFISSFSLKTINSKVSKKLYYVSDLLFINIFKKTSFGFDGIVFFNNYSLCKNKSLDFLVFISSLFGLPPALGFFSKALVYFDLASNYNTILFFFAILILSPISSFAYLKLMIYSLVDISNYGSYSKILNTPVFVKKSNKNNYFINYKHISSFLIISSFFLPIFF